MADEIPDEVIRAFLRAIVTIEGAAPGHVVDVIEVPALDDPQWWDDCGLPRRTGDPRTRDTEDDEFRFHVVRRGLQAIKGKI